jgi:cell division transport system permease protein
VNAPDPGRLRLAPTADANRVVPPSGFTAWLTVFVSAAMAYLAVFALALLFATDRLADRWSAELARTATIRISAPSEQIPAQVEAALTVLAQTPGIASARALDDAEQQRLLEPWFGPDLPLDALPVPRLIEIVEEGEGFDAEGLRLRLRAEVPGAILDDHTRWRQPLVAAAGRLRVLGWLSLVLIAGVLAAMVMLAASASLAANARVIDVLRLIGARDSFVARAFTRRFTLRALGGAAAGTLLGMASVALLPRSDGPTAFLTDLAFRGPEWGAPLLIPLLAGATAFWTTRLAALRRLKETR